MTVLLALVGPPATHADREVRALLARAVPTGPCATAVSRIAPDVVLGAATPAWDEANERRMASDGRYTVLAHAAVFYLSTLNAALVRAGERPCTPESSGADRVLAAVRAWRWKCVDHLEGEFSFIVWDSQERTLFAARDPSGARTLFFTRIGDGIAVGSTLRMVRAVPGCRREWNILALAEDAADIDLAHANETAFAAIERLPGGHALQWIEGRAPTTTRWWEVPIFEVDSGVPFEEAAEELRRLIAHAVAERSDLSRGSAVMLSGGYDSTAVYAAGNWRLGTPSVTAPFRSVSFSHPEGDPGREDELIASVNARWGAAPYFILAADVPAIEPSLERARQRDEPFYHTYELWNRALALGCRTQGARVALNGNGGDPWFSSSPIFLADLLRQGRLSEFRREWRSLIGRMNWYRVFKVAVQPNLTATVQHAITLLRGGRPLHDSAARPIPSWLAPELRASPALLERQRARLPRRRGEGLSAAERTWFLHSAFAERTTALVFAICQREGVELRTPLLDNRIVRFAATRPRWESNSGRQNKHLLRRSMRALLPEAVVAPRSERTGIPITYLERTLRANLTEARGNFSDGMLLAKLGIGDHRKLLDDLDSYLGGRWKDLERAAALVAAVQAEWWLRTYES